MKVYEAISIILKEMAAKAKPGVTTMSINKFAEKRIKELGAISVNKGYKDPTTKAPWPTTTCIGVNNCICHGYPNEYKLQEGDIVSFDLGIKIDGQCADAALTVGVGEISNQRQRLLYYAKQTVYEVIKHMQPGANTQDLARIIEMHAISRGYLVNRRFAGHRIGEQMHMKPNIYNTEEPTHKYDILKVGEIYCVEPMLTNGKDNMGILIDPAQWCCVTMDGKDSAFFEHMVEVTENGPKILTTHFTYSKGGDNE
jgi:methionyl aminopeptidase